MTAPQQQAFFKFNKVYFVKLTLCCITGQNTYSMLVLF